MCMDDQEEKLEREVSGTAEGILVANGLQRRAKGLCDQFDLNKLEDLGKLSAEEIENTELLDWQKKSLTQLCAHCLNREMYKAWRREKARIWVAAKRQLDSAPVDTVDRWLGRPSGTHESLRALLRRLEAGRVE